MKKRSYHSFDPHVEASRDATTRTSNPEMGLDEDQVFTVWDNFKSYYYNIYTTPTGNPLCLSALSRHERPPLHLVSVHRSGATPAACCAAAQIGSGTMGENAAEFTTSTAGRAISIRCSVIRVCNKCIENIGRVQNVKQENKDDLLRTSLFRPRIRPLHAVPGSSAACPISTRRSTRTTSGTWRG